MPRLSELFFHVSGEYDTFPYAEIKAIIEAEGFSIKNFVALPQLLCVDCDVKCLYSIAKRSCFTKICGIIISKCEAKQNVISHSLEAVDYGKFLKKGQTFSVKIKTIMQSKIDTDALTRIIGRIILNKLQGVTVKLKDPDVRFLGIISNNFFVLGKVIYEPSREFLRRKIKDQPFPHPSSMIPKLARGMSNLARVHVGDIIVDPFCGTGSILVEAGLIGCRIFGSDVDPDMIMGSKLNLNYFGIPWDGLIISDAGHLPFSHIDKIITDPPYGRISSTKGKSVTELVMDFLSQALDILHVGGYISIALPDSLSIREISENLGYINVENHFIREHKSLTREISVLKKP